MFVKSYGQPMAAALLALKSVILLVTPSLKLACDPSERPVVPQPQGEAMTPLFGNKVS
jgi:hypothetical protein